MDDKLRPGWHEIELDGVIQAYEVSGQGPLCIAHSGGPGVNSSYLRMPLLEQDMKIIYLDPVGTGKSGLLPGGDYSVEEYARRVELLLARLDVTDVFLLGHSHGGFVALQYALDYPARLRGLIIYASTPTQTSDMDEEADRQIRAFAARWPDRPEAAAAVRAWQADLAGEPAMDEAARTERLDTLLPAYYSDFRKTVADLGRRPALTITYDPARKPQQWDVRGRLGSITVPTLVIAGVDDFICSPVFARQIHAEIPGSRLAVLDHSGHFPHLEEPRAFTAIVTDFVRDTP